MIYTIQLQGLVARAVRVEATAKPGIGRILLPSYDEDSAWARELRTRLRAALRVYTHLASQHDITIRFGHAIDLSGGSHDLAAAVAALVSLGAMKPPTGTAYIGELSLRGEILSARGVLAAILGAKDQVQDFVVPVAAAAEAALAGFASVALAGSLAEVCSSSMAPIGTVNLDAIDSAAHVSMAEKTQAHAELIARGWIKFYDDVRSARHVVLSGHERSRTRFAKLVADAMPAPSHDHLVEVATIHSLAGLLSPSNLRRPFRAPHHSCSLAGLLGGGHAPRPGEASLAHRGILLLDNALEFRPSTMEAVWQVLLDGHVTVRRGSVETVFPTEPALVVFGVDADQSFVAPRKTPRIDLGSKRT